MLGAIGLGGSSRVAGALAPAARPLFILSAILLVLGGLGCSRLAAALAAAGSLLLYVSMFGLTGGGSMAAMASDATAARADATTFYAGLVLVAASLIVSAVRRHRRTCRPLITPPWRLLPPRS